MLTAQQIHHYQAMNTFLTLVALNAHLKHAKLWTDSDSAQLNKSVWLNLAWLGIFNNSLIFVFFEQFNFFKQFFFWWSCLGLKKFFKWKSNSGRIIVSSRHELIPSSPQKLALAASCGCPSPSIPPSLITPLLYLSSQSVGEKKPIIL